MRVSEARKRPPVESRYLCWLSIAVVALVAAAFQTLCSYYSQPSSGTGDPAFYQSYISKSWTSDYDCFVQCFTRVNSSDYVLACGGYGSSKLLLVSGFGSNVIKSRTVFTAEKNLFFEGCTVIDQKRLAVLTWREHVILELDLDSFKLIRQIPYSHEGWGLGYDETTGILWSSDGSDKLYRLDSKSFAKLGECSVRIFGESLRYINELEIINGTIFANFYMDSSQLKGSPNFVVGIDSATCQVNQVIPLFGLEPRRTGSSVFNGIAVGDNGALLVTGKNWRHIYEVLLGDAVAPNSNDLWNQYPITAFTRVTYSFR